MPRSGEAPASTVGQRDRGFPRTTRISRFDDGAPMTTRGGAPEANGLGVKETRSDDGGFTRTRGIAREAGSFLGKAPGTIFSLHAKFIPNEAEIVGFHGREALSAPYWFEIGFVLPHSIDFDMQAPLAERAMLGIDRGHDAPMLFHGVVVALELVHEYEGRSLYVLTLAPELWELGLNRHSRIFTDGSVPEIIAATLKANALLRFEMHLVKRYERLEHVCQYRESDLAFISRLMEREGIYYFFEQRDDGENLVLVDDLSAHGPLGSGIVRFGSWGAGARDHETLERFRCKMNVLPRTVQLHDYDYLRPELEVRGHAAVSEKGRGDVVLYGENFRSPSEAERIARIRAEELRARHAVYDGAGSVYQLRSGYLFQLEQHPRPRFNMRYLCTEVEHRGKQIEGIDELDFGLPTDRAYSAEIHAIPADVQFRAARVTPWPRIDGAVDGVVDGGGDSPYAQIDEHGRYKVRIFFDESDLIDGSASTWVRMLQPHGGGTEGMHFPLRKGTEVHLVFLGGDPDRPVIVGVAPNAHKPSKVTAGNHTKNVIMTGGSNRMEMEDLNGGQFMKMSTPALESFMHMGAGEYNMVQSTQGHGREFVGGNRDGHIVGSMTQRVQGAASGTYESSKDSTVHGAATENFHTSHARTVVGPSSVALQSTHTEHVTGAISRTAMSTVGETVHGDLTRQLKSNLEETIHGNVTHTSHGTVNEVHNADKATTIAGTHYLEAAGAQQIVSQAQQEITAPTQIFAAEGVQSHTAETIVVAADATASVSAPTVIVNADGSITIQGAAVTILGSDCIMEGGSLSINQGSVAIASGGVGVDGGAAIDMVAGVIMLNC